MLAGRRGDVPFQRISRGAGALVAASALLLSACGGSIEDTIGQARDAGSSPAERCNAMYGLSDEGVAAVAPLHALAGDPNAEVARCARKAITYIDDPDAAGALGSLLGDADPGVVTSAAEALGHIGKRSSVPRLESLLASGDHGVVAAAVRALGRIGDRSVVPAVEEVALRRGATPADDVAGRRTRRLAATALGALGDPAARDTLVRVLGTDPASARAAGRALAVIYEDDVTALLPLLEQRKNLALAYGLVDVSPPGAVSALVTVLDRYGTLDLARYYLDSDDEVLEQAATTWLEDHGYSVIEIPGADE